MTPLAYIIVIVISQFVLTAGVILTGMLSFALVWLPDRTRALSLGFIGGMVGSILAVALAVFIFDRIAGSGSFGLGPFLAATLPLSIPIINDFKKYRELRFTQSNLPNAVKKIAQPTTSGMGAMPVGSVTGIILSIFLYL